MKNKILKIILLTFCLMFIVGCMPTPIDKMQFEKNIVDHGDLSSEEYLQLPASLQELRQPAPPSFLKWYGCEDSDSDNVFDKNSLLTQSTTTYSGGEFTDKCYTWNEGKANEKTRLIEGQCKNTRSGNKFSYWYADCDQKFGGDYSCVEGACVQEPKQDLMCIDFEASESYFEQGSIDLPFADSELNAALIDTCEGNNLFETLCGKELEVDDVITLGGVQFQYKGSDSNYALFKNVKTGQVIERYYDVENGHAIVYIKIDKVKYYFISSTNIDDGDFNIFLFGEKIDCEDFGMTCSQGACV
ncbi:hypothetical protein HOK51_08430 [Candidatus Woesearchaeota archaeon]|nr:hypothetical protein [Candidatus Woesearchaeota archaeon]MBT6519852.1 hypothetical protein [Candidatus Woesearchaeota archaeon]MBT7367144.1 hypothetical protein [Candidatus Woesearchaeota archaeon]